MYAEWRASGMRINNIWDMGVTLKDVSYSTMGGHVKECKLQYYGGSR